MSRLSAHAAAIPVSRAGATDWRDLLALAKPGIVKMVTITAAVGFMLSALIHRPGGVGATALAGVACLIGAALSAAGANALNQALEARRDALMPRTVDRPIPAGRVSVSRAFGFGALLCVLGVSMLAIINGPAPAFVSLFTIATYLLWYTPLKPVTPLSTIVGALPGALPPLIGWTAAAGGAFGALGEMGGWSVVLIIFVWQIPHFLAIAWKYREDYAAGGYAVLPAFDPTGARTSWAMLVWSAALVVASIAPPMWLGGLVGPASLVVLLLAGSAFLWTVCRFAASRSNADARLVFVASILYLPLALLTLVVDAAVRSAIA
jgi:protoheme IX farnesyltransferase